MADGARSKLTALAGAALLTSGIALAQSSKTTPAAVPAGAASSPPGGSASAGQKKAPSVAGGYSWSDKPRKGQRRRHRKRRPRLHFNPEAPIATFPGFRMLRGGKSQVWVNLSRKVDVRVRRAAGRVVYVLGGAEVSIRNNTNALVTTYFNTPLARARLVPTRGSAELVLELRQKVEPSYRLVDGPHGTCALEVTLPPARGNLVPPDRSRPSSRLRIESGAPSRTLPRARSRGRRVGPRSGPKL